MKRWGRRLLVLLILGGIGYGSWFLFLRPTGFTNQVELTEHFFTFAANDGICEETFDAETMALCESFRPQLAQHSYTIESVRSFGSQVTITLTSDAGDVSFTVTFQETPTTGVRRYLHPVYYTIDTIE